MWLRVRGWPQYEKHISPVFNQMLNKGSVQTEEHSTSDVTMHLNSTMLCRESERQCEIGCEGKKRQNNWNWKPLTRDERKSFITVKKTVQAESRKYMCMLYFCMCVCVRLSGWVFISEYKKNLGLWIREHKKKKFNHHTFTYKEASVFNISSNFSFYITPVRYVALQFLPSSWHLRIKIKYNTGAGYSVGRWQWLLAHIESWGFCTMQSIKSVFSLFLSVCSCLVKVPQRVCLYLPVETMLSRLTSLDGRPGEKLLRLL